MRSRLVSRQRTPQRLVKRVGAPEVRIEPLVRLAHNSSDVGSVDEDSSFYRERHLEAEGCRPDRGDRARPHAKPGLLEPGALRCTHEAHPDLRVLAVGMQNETLANECRAPDVISAERIPDLVDRHGVMRDEEPAPGLLRPLCRAPVERNAAGAAAGRHDPRLVVDPIQKRNNTRVPTPLRAAVDLREDSRFPICEAHVSHAVSLEDGYKS